LSPPSPEDTVREPPREAHRSAGSWLNATVVGVGLASLLSDLSHEAVTVVLPGFLVSLGGAAGVLGLVEGVADGVSTLAKFWGGRLADRLPRRKPLCVGGYGLMALSPAVIAVATHWGAVLGGRTLAWLARGLRTPARKVLLAEATTAATRGRAFGFERALDTTGAILAPLLAVALLQAGLSRRGVILLSAIPALLAVLAITLLVRETRRPAPRPAARAEERAAGYAPRFKQFLAAVALFGAGDFADSLYILYAGSVLAPKLGGVQAAAISGLLYALHNLLYAGCAYLGGWMADRREKRWVLACGYGAAALAALGMALGVESIAGLAFMFALAGAGVGIYEAVEDALAADLLEPELRGRGFGALGVVTGLGDVVSSAAFGWIWSGLGVRAASLAAAVPMAAGAFLVLLLSRNERRRR
jgi:MFS family permease